MKTQKKSQPAFESRNIRLPNDLWDRLRKIAESGDRPIGYLIRHALRQFVESYNGK